MNEICQLRATAVEQEDHRWIAGVKLVTNQVRLVGKKTYKTEEKAIKRAYKIIAEIEGAAEAKLKEHLKNP